MLHVNAKEGTKIILCRSNNWDLVTHKHRLCWEILIEYKSPYIKMVPDNVTSATDS